MGEVFELHQARPSDRVYEAHYVDLQAMRQRLSELASRALEEGWNYRKLDLVAREALRHQVRGARAVDIDARKDRLFIEARGPERELYQYAVDLPPNWPVHDGA